MSPAGNDNRYVAVGEANYTELVSTSNFSFLRGGSHPEELAIKSAVLGLKGFGLTDRNSFAGVVRAYVALRDMDPAPPRDFRYLVGTRLCFADGTPDIIAYPSDRQAYGRLCKLLSIGNMNGERERQNSFSLICCRVPVVQRILPSVSFSSLFRMRPIGTKAKRFSNLFMHMRRNMSGSQAVVGFEEMIAHG